MNKNLFKSAAPSRTAAPANTRNLAGGIAYSLDDKAALAQMAATGCFGNTFYASASSQLDEVVKRAEKVEPAFLAKLAVYSRKEGYMKDMPAMLLAMVMSRDIELFKKTFPKVIDNGKMLRDFCQIVRSGKCGRKSFGTAAKKMIQNWLNNRSDYQLFNDSIGNDPSLMDVIKMVHPKANTKEREAFYAYLLGYEKNKEMLPKIVKDFEAFKKAEPGKRAIPNVNFQMLTALPLSTKEWTDIALNMGWTATRMNLNTFMRHDVLKDNKVVNAIADKLASKEEVKKAKVFPYQLLVAYLNSEDSVPTKIKNALQDALEVATENVPSLNKKVFVMVDSSGSMQSAVTGARGSATSKVTCNNVAALMAATILRSNEETTVMRFDTSAEVVNLNSRDSVMTNAQKINRHGGGTDCSAALRLLNSKNAKGDLLIMISDNESWHSFARSGGYSMMYGIGHRATDMATEWKTFKSRNPKAKLVLIDLTPNVTTQVNSDKDVLNVGGFSDAVFDVVASFVENTSNTPDFWVKKIEAAVDL